MLEYHFIRHSDFKGLIWSLVTLLFVIIMYIILWPVFCESLFIRSESNLKVYYILRLIAINIIIIIVYICMWVCSPTRLHTSLGLS